MKREWSETVEPDRENGIIRKNGEEKETLTDAVKGKMISAYLPQII